jgi:ABC-type branched-subunit amino acid transport system substrate-binding protein
VALKAEIPIVNSASTDPTVPETYIPWYFTDIQDDRVQSYTLARRIYTELGLKRVAILRVNNRYGRLGVPKFRDASRRLGHPAVIEQKFFPGDSDFSRQLRVIQDSRADAIILWTDQIPAARILKQMRALGMKQRVFGSYRTLGDDLLAEAGPAAEGFEAVFPYDPTRNDPRWLSFNQRFTARFHEKPEQFASLAYDAMNALLDSICKAGLNRARIHDALANIEEYDGVTGHMVFDPNQKNVAPMYLGTVHNGAITYRIAKMSKQTAASHVAPQPEKETAPPVPYARIDENSIDYAGPQRPDVPDGPVRVVVFGPDAEKIAQSDQMQAALAGAHGRSWKLLPVGSDANWRAANWPVWAASNDLVHAMVDDRALAVIALSDDAAHLAEQLSLKCFVPVLALSGDRRLTTTNVPWIFRLPEKTTPAEALHLLIATEVTAGANPQAVREALASGHAFAGFAFNPAGELR